MKSYFNYAIDSAFPVLPFLLMLSLLAIIVLSVSLFHYKRRLHRSQEYPVRYITCKEFIKIIEYMLKRMMYLPLFLLLALPLGAQEKADSVYEFRFVPRKDMFFIPYRENHDELQRLAAFIDQYREAITDGKIPVYVDGYCNSLSGEAENLNVAKLRSNRVKAELILHEGMKEESFVTRNHAEKGDWVTVRIAIPALPETDYKSSQQKSSDYKSDETLYKETSDETPPVSSETPPAPVSSEYKETPVSPVSADLQSDDSQYKDLQSAFSLRFNLLRWATLTPDLGLEYRINRNLGILLNGSWTSWSWSDKDRRYALWKVSPEVRYYIGKEKRGFLGAMYHIGQFNYKPGNAGKEGDCQGGGITGGYTLELNRVLSLDFHAALGYTHADYDKYRVIDGIRVRRGSDTKNYWGINQLGVTLVWLLN